MFGVLLQCHGKSGGSACKHEFSTRKPVHITKETQSWKWLLPIGEVDSWPTSIGPSWETECWDSLIPAIELLCEEATCGLIAGGHRLLTLTQSNDLEVAYLAARKGSMSLSSAGWQVDSTGSRQILTFQQVSWAELELFSSLSLQMTLHCKIHVLEALPFTHINYCVCVCARILLCTTQFSTVASKLHLLRLTFLSLLNTLLPDENRETTQKCMNHDQHIKGGVQSWSVIVLGSQHTTVKSIKFGAFNM